VRRFINDPDSQRKKKKKKKKKRKIEDIIYNNKNGEKKGGKRKTKHIEMNKSNCIQDISGGNWWSSLSK
jgi:hypothetical protein